jgi:hypothetical protein
MIAATLIDFYVHCYVFDICNVWTGFLQHPRVQLGDHELASGDWREGEVLFPL